MSRTTLLIAGVVLGVGCLVVIGRAQDATTGEPQPLPAAGERASTSDGEPTPARSPNPELAQNAEPESAPIQQSEYQIPSAKTPEKALPNVVKRPSSADRLQQVRESANQPGRATTIQGPVMSDPTNLRTPRVAEQPKKSDTLSPTRSSRSTSITDSVSGGGSSVLKKAETGESSGDQKTARRILRSPNKPTQSAAPRIAPAQPQPQPAAMMPRPTPVDKVQPVMHSRGPSIRVETNGPKAIRIGTEATYTVHVENEGDTEANDVFVRVGVPVTAKVIAVGSAAETGNPTDAPHEQRFVWTIARLAPRSSETLTLRITPTDGKPIDLFVDWTIRPVSGVAQIEVQQPQLEMSVFGPKDIAYGEMAKYTIRLTNPGNGDADEVTVEFGYGQDKLEPRRIGTLAAGQQQEISLELTARQTGAMPVVATASASGGLRAEASQEVLVRRAALEAEVTGDASVFAGSPATYRVVIRNAGNAPANQVAATITLPNGAQLIQASDEARPDQNGLAWNLGVLPTNAERVLDLQCLLTAAGDNAIRVQVAGAGDLEGSGSFVTKVEALADLKLTVNDPQGPVAVGQDAVFEIHISNRGTKAATKINVVAQFSPGIEPIEAKGSQAEIVPGQVLFNAIPRIDPGQEVTLIVRARADSQGPKRFRAEVSCEEVDTQLVAQETTQFFADSTKTSKAKSSGGVKR